MSKREVVFENGTFFITPMVGNRPKIETRRNDEGDTVALIGIDGGANYGAPSVAIFEPPVPENSIGILGYVAQIATIEGATIKKGKACIYFRLYRGEQVELFSSFAACPAPEAEALLRSVTDPRWFEQEELPCLELEIGKVTTFQKTTYLVRKGGNVVEQVKGDVWDEVLPHLERPFQEFVSAFSWNSYDLPTGPSFTQQFSVVDADNTAGWNVTWNGSSSDPLDSWYQSSGKGTAQYIAVLYNLMREYPGTAGDFLCHSSCGEDVVARLEELVSA